MNDTYGSDAVIFKKKGSSNSFKSDVELYIKDKFQFGLQCKLIPAQSSQFVVETSNTKFVFSNKNKSPRAGTVEIIEHMNQNFEYYSSNAYSIYLKCSQELMFNRIVQQHKTKNQHFFVASAFKNNFSSERPIYIDEIESISKYFVVSGKYRYKPSGSKNASTTDVSGIADVININQKFYMRDPDNKLPQYFKSKLYLQFANSDGLRLIRKLSSTNNKNVILTLNFRDNIPKPNASKLQQKIESILNRKSTF